ncbi:MAG TPA: GNAT family N-acetyltransferase [Sphingomonadaceae bacterium]|nr:GNAT family N-acetyltransferase [Sphingomonadaceae bacterium]
MTDAPTFTIRLVDGPADLEAVIRLFRAYAESLPVDLAYQGFEAEMAAMPGKYASPKGVLLIARDGAGRAVGCAALRPLEPDTTCEMKRLYVAAEGRGQKLGKRLVERLFDEARAIGYREMRLDTLPSMLDAQALYRRFGFEPMEPYYDTPVEGTVFMRKAL